VVWLEIKFAVTVWECDCMEGNYMGVQSYLV